VKDRSNSRGTRPFPRAFGTTEPDFARDAGRLGLNVPKRTGKINALERKQSLERALQSAKAKGG
jgi:hypothetical protein